MSLHLSLVPQPQAGNGDSLDLAVISDRIGWEEKRILESARSQGAKAEWLNDGELCCGSREDLPPASTYLMRSRSFVRGPLIAETIAGENDRQVINPAHAIATCSNKVSTLATLRQIGLATVPYRLVLTRKDLAKALATFGAPVVLKPVYGGLGRRVMLVRELAVADSMYDYVEHYGQNFDRALIAQPYLEGASDVRVFAIDGEPIAAMERIPGEDWRANVELGAEGHPIEIDDRIRSITAEVGERIGAKIYGLDLFRWEDTLMVGEVNHSPMFKGIVEATEIDVAEMIATSVLGIPAP